MKKLPIISAKFTRDENPAKFLFLALDDIKSQEAIKAQAEDKKISESDVAGRYQEVQALIENSKLNNNPQALAKFTEAVQASLSNETSKDFPLIVLSKFNTDTEKGLDRNEFSSYVKYLNQMLSGIENMPELHENYKTPTEKRKAYEILTKYDTAEPKGAAEMVKDGKEIETIEARIKIYETISGNSYNNIVNNMKGSWYYFGFTRSEQATTQDKLEEIRGKLFKSSYDADKSSFKNCPFEGWDGPGDANFNVTSSESISEHEFLQRILTQSDISGAEIAQAFSTTPSISKQKSNLSSKIAENEFDEGENLEAAKEKLENLKKSERLEKFLNSLEKWPKMEKEGFSKISAIRNNLGGNSANLAVAMKQTSKILQDFSDYYETNDNMWDWGWTTDIIKSATPVGVAQVATERSLRANGFGSFGQQNAEWIVQSDTNLGIALRAVKDTEAAGNVIQDLMVRYETVSKIPAEQRSKEDKEFFAGFEKNNKSDLDHIKKIKELAKDKAATDTEIKEKATDRYETIKNALRKSNGDFSPAYLDFISVSREDFIKTFSAKMAFVSAAEEYTEANGLGNLEENSVLAKYIDMKGLGGTWLNPNWSDEHVEMGKEMAKMLVVMIVTTIATAGASAILASAAAAAEGTEAVAATALAVDGLAGMEGGEAVITAINGIKGIKNAETIAAALEGINGADKAKSAVIAAAETYEAANTTIKATKMGNLGYKIVRNTNKINKLNRWSESALEIGNSKGLILGAKYAGKFGKDVLSGAATFSATETALFGVESSDQFLAKFGDNVEMFALFGVASKASGALNKLVGLAGKSNGGKWAVDLAKWADRGGTALTTEVIVFGGAQAIENGLKTGHWTPNKDEMIHLIAFSTAMRLTHTAFPAITGAIENFKGNKAMKGEFKKIDKKIELFENGLKTGKSKSGKELNMSKKLKKHTENKIKELKTEKIKLENELGITKKADAIKSGEISAENEKFKNTTKLKTEKSALKEQKNNLEDGLKFKQKRIKVLDKQITEISASETFTVGETISYKNTKGDTKTVEIVKKSEAANEWIVKNNGKEFSVALEGSALKSKNVTRVSNPTKPLKTKIERSNELSKLKEQKNNLEDGLKFKQKRIKVLDKQIKAKSREIIAEKIRNLKLPENWKKIGKYLTGLAIGGATYSIISEFTSQDSNTKERISAKLADLTPAELAQMEEMVDKIAAENNNQVTAANNNDENPTDNPSEEDNSAESNTPDAIDEPVEETEDPSKEATTKTDTPQNSAKNDEETSLQEDDQELVKLEEELDNLEENEDTDPKTKKEYRAAIKARRKEFHIDKKEVKTEKSDKERREAKRALRKQKRADIKELRKAKRNAPRK